MQCERDRDNTNQRVKQRVLLVETLSAPIVEKVNKAETNAQQETQFATNARKEAITALM